MDVNRVSRHILFWAVFFLSSVFQEIYFSSSFTGSPEWKLFFQIVFSHLLLFVIKAAVVYYCIYFLIPEWSMGRSAIHIKDQSARPNAGYLIRFILILLVGTLLLRLMVQLVIWPHLFHEPEKNISFVSQVARYLYSFFDLAPVTLAAVAIKLVQLQIRAIKHENKLIEENLRSELLYLKTQTNPHFLFNTLNSIYVLSRKQDKNAPEAILQLSKFLRYILLKPVHRAHPVKKEIELIRDFIALQKLRFQDHIDVEFEVSTDDDLQNISPLLLLPLVENAFKHSNDTKIQIHINLEMIRGNLQFTISNNIADYHTQKISEDEGIGLTNIKRQLKLLYSRYSFRTIKEGSIFRAELSIDLTSFRNV